MKKTYFLILLGLIQISCKKDKCPEPEKNYSFEATVLEQGLDCGETFLIYLETNESDDFPDGIHYADKLPSNLKIKSLKLKLNGRRPTEEESYPCTDFGPGYPHIVVLEVAERSK